jgi:hypothetical protein
MQLPTEIPSYPQMHAAELGQRILESYPPLQGADALSPRTVTGIHLKLRRMKTHLDNFCALRSGRCRESRTQDAARN